jgi:hypothetical protein
MGTRGAYGIRIDNTDKLAYNHWDSYPSGLGTKLVEQFYEKRLGEWRTLAEKLEAVNEDKKPTRKQIELFAPYTNLGVGDQSPSDWYCLTRELQGELSKTLEIGYMSCYNKFVHDSLFCEWAYIWNFDTEEFEVYQGFNKKFNAPGRYASDSNNNSNEYAGVALVGSIPFSELTVESVTELEVYDEE